MNILNLADSFSKESDAKSQQAAMLSEAQNYDLASNGGYLTVVKYAIYAMLAVLNLRLFATAIPGGWGVFVGFIAIMMEGFAIYCWNNQGKSSGNHRKALIGFCIAFTVVSVAHAAASVYEIVNGTVPLGPSISHYVFWYSHVVAFPLIFGLQIFALFVIGFTHYQAKISKERAKSQVEIAEGQATLHTEAAKLKQENDLAQQKLLHEQEKLKIKMAMGKLLAQTLEVESSQLNEIRQVADPLMRQRLAEMLGVPELAKPEPSTAFASTPPPRQYLTPPPQANTAGSNYIFPSADDQSK